MAGTPKWGILHTRFASSARDAVTSAQVDGNDLSRIDRDTYLNYGWQEYVSLFYNIYFNRLELLQKALQSMVKISTATTAPPNGNARILSSGLPTDFGFFLSIDRANVDSVSRLTAEEFIIIKNGHLPAKVATFTNQYCLPQVDSILLLPNSIGGGLIYDIAYIVTPFNIVFNATVGTDIPLDASHFTSILGLALSTLYQDRLEFELAAKKRSEALLSAPFPLVTK